MLSIRFYLNFMLMLNQLMLSKCLNLIKPWTKIGPNRTFSFRRLLMQGIQTTAFLRHTLTWFRWVVRKWRCLCWPHSMQSCRYKHFKRLNIFSLLIFVTKVNRKTDFAFHMQLIKIRFIAIKQLTSSKDKLELHMFVATQTF